MLLCMYMSVQCISQVVFVLIYCPVFTCCFNNYLFIIHTTIVHFSIIVNKKEKQYVRIVISLCMYVCMQKMKTAFFLYKYIYIILL